MNMLVIIHASSHLQYLFLEAVFVIQCPNHLVIECFHVAFVVVHADVNDDDDGDDDGELSWVEMEVFLYVVAFVVVHVAQQGIRWDYKKVISDPCAYIIHPAIAWYLAFSVVLYLAAISLYTVISSLKMPIRKNCSIVAFSIRTWS